MTIEADIVAILSPLAPNKVFPDVAPEGTAPPYIVYQEVGGEEPVFLERAEPSKENGRFQIAVWAPTRMEAKAIAKQATTAMVMATLFQAKPIGGRTATFDEDTQLRGTRQDFSVWSER